MMTAIAVIPARFHSTRFPGKPLAKIAGKAMVERVYCAAFSAKRISKVIVASDSDEILKFVRAFGGHAELTSSAHRSGTERVAEVARGEDADIILNVQGDEPLIRGDSLDELVEEIEGRASEIATLATARADRAAFKNPNCVKVVTDRGGDALYFSRSGIPSGGAASFLLHVGVYAFRSSVLAKIVTYPPTPLEQAENLEQIRWMENGKKISVVRVNYPLVSVDTPEDVARAELFLRRG
jgi:3-deoxy-manno-octulosonate cytidylyltransferase (CMP-KDO synthetase)